MRPPARLLIAVLACPLALAACGARGTADADGPASGIPDDFPLASGMGGPEDAIATTRTGTGLRDLELCSTSPLRGLGTRDRMVADNSGGESADTRELVLLGSADRAVAVARTFADLPSTCASPERAGDMGTVTEVRASPFGPRPMSTLVQTYTVDGEPGPGATVIQVVPVGAALLVTSTYGQWPGADLEEGVASTVGPLRETVDALGIFDEPDGDGTRVGSARRMGQTYGEGSLASLDEQADGVTGTPAEILPARCVLTRTGC